MSDIRELIRLLDETSLQEVHIEVGDMKVHLRKPDLPGLVAPPTASLSLAAPPSQALSAQLPHLQAPPSPVAESGEAPGSEEGIAVITSPMVGTFYRAPSPTAPSYVEAGTRVTEKSVVCIVEAMKLMNEIEADVRGEIVEVMAENGHLVEYGQPLFRVKLA